MCGAVNGGAGSMARAPKGNYSVLVPPAARSGFVRQYRWPLRRPRGITYTEMRAMTMPGHPVNRAPARTDLARL